MSRPKQQNQVSKQDNKSTNRKGRSSKRYNKKESVGKSDDIKIKGGLNSAGRDNNPNWYFSDANQAEVMSRIQMNGFAGTADSLSDYHPMPTIQTLFVNPCPGVTPNSSFGADTIPVSEFKMGGINRAAQKLWYILTAKSGRAAGYTKPDVALLILALGAMIETYEFIRRVFGLSYVYSNRNRTLPTLLWKAMNVDPDDYRANAAVYLKRMNSLMAVMNQLPIMGNIAFFAKCQDIFQNIYMDYPSEMAQLYMFIPSTTWVLEENDGFVGGSYLRTVDMCLPHEKEDNAVVGYYDTYSTSILHGQSMHPAWDTGNLKTLGDYIDVFEEQINALLFSSSFAVIYADILRAFDTGTLSRWSFDYIDEKYVVAPTYNENALWQIHNATIAAGLGGIDRSSFHGYFDPTNYTYEANFGYGTPLNDVYQWAKDDIVVYNPVLWSQAYMPTSPDYGTIDWSFAPVDFPNTNPSVEERIENTRYIISRYEGTCGKKVSPYGNFSLCAPAIYAADQPTVNLQFLAYSWNLPDHWIEYSLIWNKESGKPYFFNDYRFTQILSTPAMNYVQPTGTFGNMNADIYTKFHNAPLRVGSLNPMPGQSLTPRTAKFKEVWAEITAWAKVDYEWFSSINRMIYVDLFDIR